MGKTSISWTNETWNPTRGCSRVSPGCQHCYAEVQAARIVRMGNGKPTAYDGLVRMVGGEPRWTGEVRLVPEMLAWPLRKKKPLRIFVNSMSDLFHEKLTNEQIAAVFGVMAACPQHTFQVLTKRAKRMREWFEWVGDRGDTRALRRCGDAAHDAGATVYDPVGKSAQGRTPWNDVRGRWPLPNVWLGVSVENQEAADERIPELLRTPAAVRFLSCEPLLGPVHLHSGWPGGNYLGYQESIDWIIAGCESGPGARPCSVEWLRSLRDQCASAGVAFFLKQANETAIGRCGDADNPNGDHPCARKITAYIISPDTAAYSCGCTMEASELGACVPLGFGDDSSRKPGGVIELPYLDGVQHAAFPESR